MKFLITDCKDLFFVCPLSMSFSLLYMLYNEEKKLSDYAFREISSLCDSGIYHVDGFDIYICSDLSLPSINILSVK